MTVALVTAWRNIAAVARFYQQPLSEIERLPARRFGVMLSDMVQALERGVVTHGPR